VRRITPILIGLTLFAAACSGGSNDTVASLITASSGEESTTTQESTTSESPTEVPNDFDISNIEASVVKIVSEGTFVDPQIGLQLNSAGVGSGFIISDSGLVVTNNHVVTGAALLRVYTSNGGEPLNARILGVSECSDLAVIQLEGNGHPALSFREDAVRTGLDVFAAGYPASDASTIEEVDYTLTRGIVSSLTAGGETNWASVDKVLEHDARIRGGNSGGPLVDENGRVVAVNYAGIDESDQNFAIAAADARPIIERLAKGENVESIGVNGQAVTDAAEGVSGIWVASVDSGSPADKAGLRPGDIITQLEGLVLATDGTMSDYCDVIRTQGPDATMAIEVLRYDTQEILEGQLNGDPLVQSFSFAQEFEDDVAPTPNNSGSSLDTYTEYMTVSDDSGLITVDIPVEWSDVNGSFNESFGPSIWAAPNIDNFSETWETPGIKVEATANRTIADVDLTLDEIDFSEACTNAGREPYEDTLYTGTLQLWTDCGGTDAIYIVLAAAPFDGNYLIRVEIQAIEPRDLDAADQVLNTFVADLD